MKRLYYLFYKVPYNSLGKNKDHFYYLTLDKSKKQYVFTLNGYGTSLVLASTFEELKRLPIPKQYWKKLKIGIYLYE